MSRQTIPASVWRNPVHFLAFGCGAGAVPVAPGTFGSLVAVPLYLLLQGLPLAYYLIVVAGMLIFGIWLCGRTAADIGVHDHGGIVWDEIVGYLLTMAAAPPGGLAVALGFFLFRLFDILKPWPIRLADRQVGGGFGIMLDDVLAAVYSWLVLQGIMIMV
jgi:phosphatidylglycerophosphatase A